MGHRCQGIPRKWHRRSGENERTCQLLKNVGRLSPNEQIKHQHNQGALPAARISAYRRALRFCRRALRRRSRVSSLFLRRTHALTKFVRGRCHCRRTFARVCCARAGRGSCRRDRRCVHCRQARFHTRRGVPAAARRQPYFDVDSTSSTSRRSTSRHHYVRIGRVHVRLPAARVDLYAVDGVEVPARPVVAAHHVGCIVGCLINAIAITSSHLSSSFITFTGNSFAFSSRSSRRAHRSSTVARCSCRSRCGLNLGRHARCGYS